ncbi:type IV pilin N-terminal domain-containing protein [Methanoregula sp.]|uniref:type IV pilin N-terminal domain-containing protein n=1 Tax=Methanoregula sp. TaxID=2052170 RepID=UPI003567A652
MQSRSKQNAAVSEVVGEMLMIGIVLILVAVFSASLSNYLPSERSPTVTIRMSNDTTGNITLWHKGGDWVKADTMRVIVSDATNSVTKTYTIKSNPPFLAVPSAEAFDLGDNLTVDWGGPLDGNESVVLATDRAVIFSGRIEGGTP